MTELLAVICILGMIASAGMFSLSAAVRRAERATSLTSLEANLSWAFNRSFQEPVQLTVDLQSQTLQILALSSGRLKQQKFTGGLKMVEVQQYGLLREQGAVKLDFRNGSCETFAIHVHSTGGEQDFDRWLFVLGATGEVIQFEHSPQTSAAISNWLAKWSSLN
ncbi:MAG: type II secretion system protein [Pirellulales bacterium]